jgi:ferredoxin
MHTICLGAVCGISQKNISIRRCEMWQVDVDKDKCTGCEECVNSCPAGVLELVDDKSDPVNMDECLGCETCVEVCPEGAITVSET